MGRRDKEILEFIKQDRSKMSKAKEEVKTNSNVIKPSHYERWVREPVNFIMQNETEFWRGNIVKYVMRAGYKHQKDATPEQIVDSEIEDLKKVIRYAEMRINQIKGKLPNDISQSIL